MKYLLLFLSLILVSCSTKKPETNSIEISFERFDKLLKEGDIYEPYSVIADYYSKHPAFTSLYTNKIIEVGDISDKNFNVRFQSFLTDQNIYHVINKVGEEFDDITSIELATADALGNYKFWFPNKSIPQIYTYISGFNQSVVTGDNFVCISLEKYLGKDEPYYDLLYPPVPKYQRARMIPERIPLDILHAVAVMEYPFNAKKDNLLSRMLYEARTTYFVKQMFPEVTDILLWNFSKDQLIFCKNNEEQMWTFLIEHKLLFETKDFTINQYINEAPFTKEFTKESPGRATVWIGYQIVESYMKRNNSLTLEQLMSENDFQLILSESHYKP